MPFPNFHALRLRPPGIFAKDSFRTTKGGSLFGGKLKVPASINLIWAKLKGKSAPDDPPILQAIRFNKSQWTVASAKAWIKKNISRKGLFEPASNNSEAHSAAITDEGLADALLLGDLEAYEAGEAISYDDIESMEFLDYEEGEEIDSTSDVAATMVQLMTQDEDLEVEEERDEKAVTDSEALAEKKPAPKKERVETQDVDNVEIFSTGKWGTESYSAKDLDLIVANFQSLRDEIKPPNKLGHGKQGLLSSAGLPAAGWVTGLKRVGNKLIASLSDVPNRIARIIKNRGYKRVSVEIYSNYQDSKGKRRGLVLKALAFLGGDIPAVKTLKDVEVLYADDMELADNPYRRVTLMADLTEDKKDALEEKEKEEETDEEKKDDLETDEEEEKKETPEKKEDLVDKPTELAETKLVIPPELKSRMDDMEQKLATATNIIAQLQVENKSQKEAMAMAESESFLDGLVMEGKFPPALKPKAVAMMSVLRPHEGEVLTYSEDGDVDIETNPLALFKDMLGSLSVVIDMAERAEGGKPTKPGQEAKSINDSAYRTAQNYDVQGAEVVDKVQKLMEANPELKIEDAILQVSREQS